MEHATRKELEDLIKYYGFFKLRVGQDSFFLLKAQVPVFGEVFRFFEDGSIVIFNQLVKTLFNKPLNVHWNPVRNYIESYTYIYKWNYDILPKKFNCFEGNRIYLNKYPKKLIIEFVEYITKNAIKQFKEFQLQCSIDEISEDFKQTK